MCAPIVEKFGATPANIQWTVVRGDTATLVVEFLEDDEVTGFDTSDWTYKATAYDPVADLLDDLSVEADGHVVTITAPASVTELWGSSAYKQIAAELKFDLEVIIEGGSGVNADTVWTPVLGSICVLSDITPGL
jgi:hypothetical protein